MRSNHGFQVLPPSLVRKDQVERADHVAVLRVCEPDVEERLVRALLLVALAPRRAASWRLRTSGSACTLLSHAATSSSLALRPSSCGARWRRRRRYAARRRRGRPPSLAWRRRSTRRPGRSSPARWPASSRTGVVGVRRCGRAGRRRRALAGAADRRTEALARRAALTAAGVSSTSTKPPAVASGASDAITRSGQR